MFRRWSPHPTALRILRIRKVLLVLTLTVRLECSVVWNTKKVAFLRRNMTSIVDIV